MQSMNVYTQHDTIRFYFSPPAPLEGGGIILRILPQWSEDQGCAKLPDTAETLAGVEKKQRETDMALGPCARRLTLKPL